MVVHRPSGAINQEEDTMSKPNHEDTTTTIIIEVGVLVSNFLDDPEGVDAEEAFDMAAAAKQDAIDEAEYEASALAGLTEEQIAGLIFKHVEFVEFDSGNPIHACAMHQVRVTGSASLIALLEKGLFG
jgi:hypothetical protein